MREHTFFQSWMRDSVAFSQVFLGGSAAFSQVFPRSLASLQKTADLMNTQLEELHFSGRSSGSTEVVGDS